jgi:hypothetical protein
MTTITIPIEGMKLGAALNARVHWTKRAARAKKERAIVAAALRHHPFAAAQPPTTCTLIRIAPRMLDDDNLAGAFKSIRDEVAAFFGVDDGPKGPISWRYEQRKSAPKQYAVHIALAWGE